MNDSFTKQYKIFQNIFRKAISYDLTSNQQNETQISNKHINY